MPADVEVAYRQAVGSAAVEGIVFDEAFLALLRQVADGTLSPDAAVAQLVAEYAEVGIVVWPDLMAGWRCGCGRFAGPYGSERGARSGSEWHTRKCGKVERG